MGNSNTFDNWTKSPKPIFALAPMADLTDGPFCRVCREVNHLTPASPDERARRGGHDPSPCKGEGNFSHPFVIFREMVSAEAIVRGNEKTLKMCEFEETEKPIVLQLFGSDPDTIARAAEILVGKRPFDSPSTVLRVTQGIDTMPSGIDINMGCPVPKIASKGHAGADLMRDPERAVNIVKALKKADLGVSISVKTRLGWASEDEILRFAPLLEEAGLDALTIHGRTKKQGYSGQANWEMIGKVKKILDIPVIANGDIENSEDIRKCLEITGADGVMIGRAALGNPWVFGTIDYRLLTIDQIVKVVLRHAKLHLERYGDGGMTTFRKHLLYYFKGFDGAVELRQKLVKVSNLDELKQILTKSP